MQILRKLRVLALLPLFLAAAVSIVRADDPLKIRYEGSFELRPQIYHPKSLTGSLRLAYASDGLREVSVKLDQVVVGASEYVSSEQWASPIAATSGARYVAAFKFKKPPHKWFFVVVATSVDGNLTLEGPLYKVPEGMEAIQGFAAKGPAEPIPAAWKPVGSVTLKAKEIP